MKIQNSDFVCIFKKTNYEIDSTRSILLDSVHYGHFSHNSGLTAPIKIVAPKGTLCNPIFPAPTIARFMPGNVVADTLMKAFSQIVPKQVSAGVGNLKAAALSGRDGEDYWVYMDIFEGSYGGRCGKDPMDAVDTLYANTRNNPIEDIESHYPLRVTRYELRDYTCAPGQWRGGIGSIREIQFLSDGNISVEGDGNKYKPWGFEQGSDGYVGGLSLVSPDGEATELPSKIAHLPIKAGYTLRFIGTCGGGYGNPLKRDINKVYSDVLDDYVNVEQAKSYYGVVIENDLSVVDLSRTKILRETMRSNEK